MYGKVYSGITKNLQIDSAKKLFKDIECQAASMSNSPTRSPDTSHQTFNESFSALIAPQNNHALSNKSGSRYVKASVGSRKKSHVPSTIPVDLYGM